ncbi:MAG: hypothetical protein NT099_03490, partial [Candidatus Saganbacteria bacterium]|nr:hypothetical protein [Candidatus Saganbacteria bacterium]
MAGFSPEILAYLGGVVPGAPPAPDGGTCDQDTLEQIYDFYEKNLKRKYPDPAASLGTAIGNISPHPFLLKNLPCVMSLTQKPGTWTLLEEYVVAAYVKEGWLMAQAALKAAELSLQEAESTGNEDFKKGARKYALIAKLIIYTLMGPQAKDRPTMERKELDEITAFHNTPPRLLEYLKVLGMLVDGASKAPRYDREKNQMPGQHLYEYGTYHLPLKDSDPILRPSSLSSAMLSCQAILGLGKKDPASMKVGIDALEKIRAEFPMIDKKTPALIYDDCFFPDPKADVSLIAPHCASRGNYTDEALGIDFKLATAYAEAGNPTEALTHLQYMITGQDPDHPARSEYAKPPQEFPYRRERIKNFAGAIPILFQIIKGAAEKAKTPEEVQANIEDARALYLYFLNPGSPRPRFKGTYAKQADQILGALLKYEGTILLIQKDPAGLDANDKDMRKQLLLVIKPAEMQKATESIYLDVAWEALRVARDFLGDEKEGIQATAENPDLALPYLAKARVLLEKFKPEGKISPEMLDDARGDLALLATLYVRWADRTVEEKLGPGVSASMRDMLEPEVKKKLEAAEEALAVFYAPPFNGIGFDNVSQKTGVKSRGGVGTLLYIASVYTGLANSMATNSQSFSSAEKYLKEADRVLRRAQGHVNIMNTEEQASPPETLGYIAVVYAKLAEKNKIIDKDESRRFAEIAIKYAVECENTPGGSKKALLSVLISVAPVYVYLGDFAKAKDLLGRVFKEGLGGGANPDLALKALSSLSWIYSEELKSLSENRETDPQKERELELKRRELALKSALLMYALVYGKAGGPEISWEALGSGNMDSAEVAALRNKDGVFNNYFSLTKDYSKQIVDAGNLSERGNSIFDNLEMPNGKTDLIFKLANALRELSKNSKHDDIKALRKAAIKLCEQVFDVLKLKGDKLSEKARKTLRDAIWVLAGLTGERIWVDKLRAELPKVKNPETRVDMTLTVASGYFALGIAEQKKGNKAEAQKLFDDSLSLYEEALRRGTEGKHPALSNHEVLDVLLKEVELFKVQKNFKRAQELLLQVSLKAEEEIQKTTEKKPPKAELIIAQLGLSKLLARLTTVEVTIAEIKQSLFRKEIDEKEALRLLTAQKEVFLQVLADEEGGKGGLNSKEAAELTAISVRTAVVLYGSLGGVSADSMEGGTLFFLEASGIIAAFLGKKIDGIGLDQLAKKDSSFKPVADMIQKALNNTSLWQGMDQIGYTEERLLVTGGDLLAEAGKTHPELLAQAVD